MRCSFVGGLVVYGAGALLASLAQGLGLMVFGYSLLEGIGSALMIPPIYILVTVAFADLKTRARYFGVVSGAAGLGAASGPLIGGVVTSFISWRASFLLQVLVVVWVIVLARRIVDPPRQGPPRRFDVTGAILSAAGLFFLVLGILQSGTYGWLTWRVWLFVAVGVLILAWFFVHLRATERAGKEPLLGLRLFRNRTANLGLGTQTVQWLTLQGTFFVLSVYVQQVRGYSAVQTGLMLTPAILGLLVSSAGAERFARRHPQRWLVVAGFTVTVTGMLLLLLLADGTSGVVRFVPGLLLIGLGIGVMLTSSVNIVQSSFPDRDQGDISGLSRSVSNLGSSLGTALAGSILVAATHPGAHPFALALATLTVIAVIGLVLAVLIPRQQEQLPGSSWPAGTTPPPAGRSSPR